MDSKISMTKMKVSFLGLGVMGYPMAGHLVSAGFDVTVFNRTTQKAKQWVEKYGAKLALSPSEAAKDADVVLMCVGDDNDVRAVAKEAIAAMNEGALLIDHTTASATVAKEIDRVCKDHGLGFLDAPVSGGQAGAENGQLTVMVGGTERDYIKAKPLFDAYSRHSQLLGECGSGQLAKMMNQICIAGIVQGLAEAAQSWQMENRAQTMLKNSYEFGFAVDWMRKDLSIALDEARRNGSTLALTALVDQYYADVQKMGGDRWDTSSLLTRLK